ncbi:MAG: hypothetical protein JWM85_1660, partial [Acidimicrobiaceae bacterium]|nr:hypothetical protein [Acidimicrobiaceae bacterium]
VGIAVGTYFAYFAYFAFFAVHVRDHLGMAFFSLSL